MLSKARSMYAWDNCTRNTLERVRGALNGLVRNIIVHALLGAFAFSLSN